MDIEEQFNKIAHEYDDNRRKFIPCFEDFYKSATAFICSNIAAPKRVVDLGAGTGLLTYYWYQQFPNTEYMLVDIADEMLHVAQKRFLGIDTISYQVANYAAALPEADFDVAISALSIHHLEDEDKARLFSKIYDRLPDGGLFVNYDQFCAGHAALNGWFDGYWESQLASSGLTDNDIALWRERKKLDRECSVEAEVKMLKDSGFQAVKCVYAYQKFAVIMAMK